ncbi:MAG: hypothetical protein JXB07_13475 [Anaerolineae bacterium]|nr:hypothetical protein [Anaerolineae bacterium]
MRQKRIHLMWFLIIAVWGLAACAKQETQPLATHEPDDDVPIQPSPVPSATITTPGGAQRPRPTNPPTPDFVQPTLPPQSGEIPQGMLDKMIDDLAARLSIDRQNVRVLSAESVIWNDGSLGCPKPGEFYTQATVPGYRAILDVDGLHYNYHASEKGYFFLCESPQPRHGNAPGNLTPDR